MAGTGVANSAPVVGQQLLSVCGGDYAAGGASCSLDNAGTVAGYRDLVGLSSEGAPGVTNTGQFVIEGTLNHPAAVLQREALSLDGTSGGLPAYVIPNWMDSGAVTITRVSGASPAF